MKLLIKALALYLCGMLIMGLLLFLPAGTMDWDGGWRLMGLLFGPMSILGIILWLKAPALLEKRLQSREKENAQKNVVGSLAIVFLTGFVISGLDARFDWSGMPDWLTDLFSLVFLLSYGLYAEVMRENAYLSRTVEVQDGQRVVDTGLYGIVRHPMYAATVLMFLSMPMVLGSWIGLIVFLAYPVLIAMRIRNEEQVLLAGLAGYGDYMKKVKYRLIPFVW